MQAERLVVGIDPGVKTGFALYSPAARRLSAIRTLGIVEAMDEVRRLHAAGMVEVLAFEDARLRTGGFDRADAAEERSGAGIREGIGSVKRDSSIWAEFAERHAIPVKPIAPTAVATKLDAEAFKAATGWAERSSQHARDAAMVAMVGAGLTPPRKRAGTAPGPGRAAAGPVPGACRACGHPHADHLPNLGNCPAGERGPAGFARYSPTKWTA